MVHVAVGVAVLALSLAAGGWGAWCWYRVRETRVFWPLLRAAQGAVVLEALIGVVLLAIGRRGYGSLHILYGVLPIAISFVAEQLRIGAADAVLAARGLDDARAVGRLPEAEQRSVVLSIVRRELGVMAVAALVIFGLAVRAATTG
ncbi:MAG: hypothetical protein JWN32_110 [Solirubrobacterales bacterium]|jgi:hypothetical protein|nr:hypothetical protein [Solirubrobacterales bacterium]